MSQTEKQVFSLKQVVQSIQKTLEDRYSTNYWVKAEMHKMNRYPSGHAFPELVQKKTGKLLLKSQGPSGNNNLNASMKHLSMS